VLPYCLDHSTYVNYSLQSGCSDGYNNFAPGYTVQFANYPCAYYDELDVRYPSAESGAIGVTSSVAVFNELLNCSVTDSSCAWTILPPTSGITYNIADVENFLIQIEHSMIAPSLGVQRNARGLSSGHLISPGGGSMALKSPDSVGSGLAYDTLQVKTVLAAAGVGSLDVPSDNYCNSSKRFNGAIILFSIKYSNTNSFDIDRIEYEMSASLFRDTDYYSAEPILLGDNQRLARYRAGVRIVFLQFGDIGIFSFQTMLINLVSGLGLLTIATVIVDQIALRVLPERKLYEQFKYETTVDMSDLKKGRVTVDGTAVTPN